MNSNENMSTSEESLYEAIRIVDESFKFKNDAAVVNALYKLIAKALDEKGRKISELEKLIRKMVHTDELATREKKISELEAKLENLQNKAISI